MCGIFGVAASKGTLSVGQTAFIRAATLVGQLRGDDGTGWIVKSPNDKPKIFKKALCGNDFLDTRIGRKGIKVLPSANVVIGHNRKTTSGGDSDNDCHPYEYDNVVGVHNGSIPIAVLNRLDIKNPVSEVDSAKLFAAFNSVKNPIDILNKVHTGAYALAWIDTRTNTLLLARNGDRPLWVANSDSGIYFASEPGMLFWLMSRYNLDSEDSKLLEISVNSLYSINLNDLSKIKRTSYKAEEPVTKLVGYVPAGSIHQRNRANAWFRDNNSKILSMYRYTTGVPDLIKQFPALEFLGPIINDNLFLVNEEYNKSGTPSRLDMVITNVKETKDGTSFPDVHGYMLDTTESGIVIAVAMNSVKDVGFDFLHRFNKAESMGSHYTCRVHITSIRVCADGTITIYANPITVWDHVNNISKDTVTAASVIVVEEDLRDRPSTLTDDDIKIMWEKLTTKCSKSVH